MILDIYAALAVATLTVILSTSDMGFHVREKFNPWGVLDCHFCTSIWVSLFTVPLVSTSDLWLRVPAVAAASNFAILLIHLSMGTVEDDSIHNEENAKEPTPPWVD